MDINVLIWKTSLINPDFADTKKVLYLLVAMGLCSACYSNVQYIQRLEGTWEEKFSIRFLIMKCQNRELPIYHIHIQYTQHTQ